MKLEVVLDGLSTQGALLVHQLKSLTSKIEAFSLIEKAPHTIIKQVTELFLEIIR